MNHIAEYSMDNLFSASLNGFEYGYSLIGKNNGVFDEQFIKDIVLLSMDDRDKMNVVGKVNIDHALDNVSELCLEYLRLIESDDTIFSEVMFLKENYNEVYKNIITSLVSLSKI